MGTLLQLSQVFTGTGPNIEIPGVEAPQGVTDRTFDLVARQAFPFADVEFAVTSSGAPCEEAAAYLIISLRRCCLGFRSFAGHGVEFMPVRRVW
jgi:hypothetical protein